MGLRPSAQYCKNVGTLIQCGECDKWRVIYSKSKLSSHETNNTLTCNSPIEIPYLIFNGMFKKALCFNCEQNVKKRIIEENFFRIVKINRK
ncbi:hypothetical protein RhiirA5_427645 [Rhizophagus irregularis]|uniref:Uncharacterized protein n=1 Tax=Rhizophagus irregularis TaxID=588596 RepID=A0A2N0P1X8_9GLOM|nr:hypothetical protein RhiirA5_427645 [Rhizophagus irregularis]